MFARSGLKVAVFLLAITLVVSLGGKAQAADSNFADGITVDSTLDTPDNNIGNGVCDDGSGNCTLRAAIAEANSNADHSTVTFNIPGAGVKTFLPGSGLPPITERITIDGYTQPGAQPNTAPAPQPLNGTLLIEINGGGTQTALPEIRASSSIIRGLVINRSHGTGVILGAHNIQILGNYIGTDPTGLLDRGNILSGINGGTTGFQDDDNAIIGSTNPADRNIISGNGDAGVTPNVNQDGWIVKGNYIGMGADGVTPISNSYVSGPGGMSIDNCTGTIVGGSEPGATNLISGNGSFGLFPDNTNGLTIKGNIIGPDWKGDAVVNNLQLGGIGFPPIAGPFINTLVGGVNANEGNLIAHNNGIGIAVIKMTFGGSPVGTAEKVSILGNSIHSNNTSNAFALSESGLGIDLLEADMSSVTTIDGPTLNDTLDVDSGPNGLINFPVINSAVQNGNQASINFNLDAAGSPSSSYRVEFFANTAADPSGYGEGQTFIGFATVANGNNQLATLTLPNNFNLSGKLVTATTTAVDGTTTSGFGSTSEFSLALMSTAVTSSVASTSSLADTGDNIYSILIFASSMLVVSMAILARQKFKIN